MHFVLSWLKSTFKRAIPSRILAWRRKHFVKKAVFSYSHYDAKRYAKFSGIDSHEIASLWAKMMYYQHVIEKALSLPEPRPGFGEWAIRGLLMTLTEYIRRVGHNTATHSAIGALRGYLAFHENRHSNPPWNIEITAFLNSIRDKVCVCNSFTPTILIRREILISKSKMSFQDLAFSRHSIRQFSCEAVPNYQIKEAVRIAQKSPSVCNRQGARAHIYFEENQKKAILQIHNGNRGFSHLASHVVIVTFDLRCLLEPEERNQAWTDSGLFAMSFLFGLHSLGLGACPLHWCVKPEDDKRLREAAKIPTFEEIIMLIVVGSLPDQLTVASSTRKDLDEVCQIHREEKEK